MIEISSLLLSVTVAVLDLLFYFIILFYFPGGMSKWKMKMRLL